MCISLCYAREYSETSLIRHSMGLETNIGLGGFWITEGLSAYFDMVTVLHQVVRLAEISDYRGAGLQRFHFMYLPVLKICACLSYH